MIARGFCGKRMERYDMEHRMPGDRIVLEKIANVRDLGGYRTQDGRCIRMHKLIRSEGLYGITDKDKQILVEEYELRKIIDFRTLAETKEKPDPVMAQVEYVHNPILNEAQMGITHEGEKEEKGLLDFLVDMIREGSDGPEKFMSDLYAELVSHGDTLRQYRRFFELLLSQEEGAVLWHCSAGKDRAGAGAIFLLWALGVDEETIRRDYLLTNVYLKESLDRMIAKLAQKVPDERVLEGVRIMNSAQESYLERLMDEITARYGSMDRFMEKELGLTAEVKEQLRKKYLE